MQYDIMHSGKWVPAFRRKWLCPHSR